MKNEYPLLFKVKDGKIVSDGSMPILPGARNVECGIEPKSVSRTGSLRGHPTGGNPILIASTKG